MKPIKWVYKIVCVALLACSLSAHAQLTDSLEVALHKKPKLSFKWDSHGSFITNTPARMTSLGLGLRFGNYVTCGLAVDWLNSDIYRRKYIKQTPDSQVDTVNAKLNYSLFSIYTEVLVGRRKKWEFSIPFELGFGSSSYTYYAKTGEKREFAKGGLITIEPMFVAEYKVFKWLGIGAGLGLRLVPYNNTLMKENFNSLLWDANLNIYFGEIYRSVARAIKKHKEEKKDGK